MDRPSFDQARVLRDLVLEFTMMLEATEISNNGIARLEYRREKARELALRDDLEELAECFRSEREKFGSNQCQANISAVFNRAKRARDAEEAQFAEIVALSRPEYGRF